MLAPRPNEICGYTNMWSSIHAKNKKQTNLDFIVSAEFGQIRVKLFDAQQQKKKSQEILFIRCFRRKKIICVSNILRCVYIVMSTNEKQAQ